MQEYSLDERIAICKFDLIKLILHSKNLDKKKLEQIKNDLKEINFYIEQAKTNEKININKKINQIEKNISLY